jgi:monoamine oxidase
MASLSLVSPLSAEEKKLEVIVIGAGIAGLTTAHRLHQKGMHVQVYEARNRVGGRIFTVNVENHIGELGGQNIGDGGSAENIHRLIEEFDLELSKTKVNSKHSYFNGEKLIPTEEFLNTKQFNLEELKKRLEDLSSNSLNMKELLSNLVEENSTLYKAMAVRLAGYEGAPIEKLSPLYFETLWLMLSSGLSVAHPAKNKEDFLVDFLSIKEGNSRLPEKLAQVLDGRIHLNKTLVQVAKGRDGSFELTFLDGQKIKGDILIMAIPCSIYNDILFQDVIPLEKLEAIKNVQYGTNAKILIPFSKTPKNTESLINDRIGGYFDIGHNILTLYYTGQSSFFCKKTIQAAYLQEKPMIELGFGTLSSFNPIYAEDQSFAIYDAPVGYSWPNDPYAKGTYSYIAPGQESLLTTLSEENGETVKTLFAPIDLAVTHKYKVNI